MLSAGELLETMKEPALYRIRVRYPDGFRKPDAMTAEAVLQMIRETPPETLQKMLGDLQVQELRTLLSRKKTGFRSLDLNDEQYKLLWNLSSMGLASVTRDPDCPEDEVWTVYREALPAVRTQSSSQLVKDDGMYYILEGALELAGAVQMQDLELILGSSMEDGDLNADAMEQATMFMRMLMAYRSGTDSFMKDEQNEFWFLPVNHRFPDSCARARNSQGVMWKRFCYRPFSELEAQYRSLSGLVLGQRAYAPVCELLLPDLFDWKSLFGHIVRGRKFMLKVAEYMEMQDSYPIARMTIRLLQRFTYEVSADVDTTDTVRQIVRLAQQQGRPQESVRALKTSLKRLGEALPRWKYRGWSEKEVVSGKARVRLVPRETERMQMPVTIRFRQLCPCGSGKIYGKCHGCVQ